MRVSNSSIQCFKRCPRMYQLRYIYKFIPIATSEALEIGSSYHEAVESVLNGEKDQLKITDPKISAMVGAFEKYVYPVIECADSYEPEKWFEHKTAGGNLIVGRYDGLGLHSVLEHKTTSGPIDGNYWAGVQDDEQLLTYMLASGKRTALYTVCQKPKLRQSLNESSEAFAERLQNWYETDTARKISTSVISHTDNEIMTHEAEIDAMCRTIARCKNFYRNRSFCRYYGRPCEYAPICNSCDPDANYIGFTKGDG